MSLRITLTISDELADLIERQRGIRSVQDFIVNAAMQACTGSPVETELRRELAALHETIRQLGTTRPSATNGTPVPSPTTESPIEKMGW